MAGLVRLALRVQGLKEIRQKVAARDGGDPALFAPAWKRAMEQIGSISLTGARQAAPRGPSSNGHVGGLTVAKLGMRLQAKPMPMWVRIETTATRPWPGHGNYSYPKRVEWDPKLRHAGWLRSTAAKLKGRCDSVLQAAGRAIETGWGT